MTTHALQAAVRGADVVFGHRKVPADPLNVCTLCCMPDALEREMRSLPLGELTTRHFYAYCDGAMNELVQPAEEIHYLLPRWLALLAAGEETHMAPELALDRVGRCPPGSFIAEETAVLDDFMLAYFDHCLGGGGFWGWSGGPLSLLIMADAGGRAVPPLLQCWLDHPHPLSTVQFVRETYWEFWPEQRLTSAFATGRDVLQAMFSNWVLSPNTRQVFAEKLCDPAVMELGELTHCNPNVSFALMTDTVFDNLSH